MSCETDIPEIELVEVSGTVVETESQSPVAGVSITIIDQEIEPKLTGSDGTFKFSDLRLDDATYEITVTHADYEDEKEVFTIENGALKEDIVISLIASEALSFNLETMDFGSGLTELSLIVSNESSTSQTITINPNKAWITPSKASLSIASGKDETISFTVDREEVEVGSFETTIAFEIEGKKTQSLSAKMQKLDPNSAILKLDKTNIDFGKALETQSIQISNEGKSTLNWTASTEASWLTLSQSSGTIEQDTNADLALAVNRNGFDNGVQEATVNFSGDGGTATLTISMEVDNSVGLLKLSTSSIDFSLTDESSQITLTNDGSLALDWSATIHENWISLDAISGSLDVSANTTINIGVDRTTLSSGVHNGSVDFTANGETSTLNIALEVQGGILEISTTSLSFGSAETVIPITFSNTGMRSLTWSSDENTSWLNMAPKDGTIDVGAETALVVEVDRAGLSLGSYSADIQVATESQSITISVSMSVAQDTDMDGVPDEVDGDFDGDGLIEIYTINDLNDIRNDLTASGNGKQGAPSGGFTGFELMNDLNFSDDNSYGDLSLKPSVTSGLGWNPIGTSNENFEAIFDGNSFIISQLLINRTTEYTALFAAANFLSEVRNLRVEIKFISGTRYTAGLLGFTDGKVINCSVSGDIQSGQDGGLLVGLFDEGEIENCFTEGSINSNSNGIGGLVGSIGNSNSGDVTSLKNSYSTAIVNGNRFVGGLVGFVGRGTHTISNSYAQGSVTATSSEVGGLVGYTDSGSTVIENCYASGNVVSSSSDIGGLVGEFRGTLVSSYSTGSVVGSSTVGGLIGRNLGSIASSNYWNTQTSNLATSSGGTGLTTSEFQGQTSNDGIYITWSSDAWDFGTSSQYPVLKNMPSGLDVQRD